MCISVIILFPMVATLYIIMKNTQSDYWPVSNGKNIRLKKIDQIKPVSYYYDTGFMSFCNMIGKIRI